MHNSLQMVGYVILIFLDLASWLLLWNSRAHFAARGRNACLAGVIMLTASLVQHVIGVICGIQGFVYIPLHILVAENAAFCVGAILAGIFTIRYSGPALPAGFVVLASSWLLLSWMLALIP
jgi:hypothetical protein